MELFRKKKSTDRELEAAALEALLEEEAKQEQERTLDDEEFRQIHSPSYEHAGLSLMGKKRKTTIIAAVSLMSRATARPNLFLESWLWDIDWHRDWIGFYLTMHLFW